MKIFNIILFSLNFLATKSYIVGLQNEIQKHPKYSKLKNNDFFQKANLVIVILEENDFVKHGIRPSRNLFGYSKYSIIIYQNETLIYKKTFRLSSFNSKNKNTIIFNENKQIENRKKVVDFTFNLLFLSDYLDKTKIKSQINLHKLDEPTSNLILFNENGKMKAIDVNFKDFAYAVKDSSPLTVIPKILNEHDIKIIKFERIFNHGIYSYIIIENIIIKIPNKNYFQNLYKILLKIELIYLSDINVFNKNSSIFFTEFDKLKSKNVDELVKLIKSNKKGC